MRIDHTHRRWAIVTGAIFLVSLAVYIPYAYLWPGGVSGGSLPGLLYGIVGYAMMIFALLLSVRKKRPIWRIGRSQTWMRGHLWLGLLSYPIILFHAGFRLGGGLTYAMIWIFSIVVVSGLVGAALQHYMPHMMTESVPMESIYGQIDHVQGQLLREADQLMSTIGRDAAAVAPQVSDVRHTTAILSFAALATATTSTTMVSMSENTAEQFRSVYADTIQPYLAKRGQYSHLLADRHNSKSLFGQLRTLTPPTIHPVIDDLENICEEKRDLDRQSRMHRYLHAWLIVHVPLSYALIIMGAIHAVVALRY